MSYPPQGLVTKAEFENHSARHQSGGDDVLNLTGLLGLYIEGARVYNNANISIPNDTATIIDFNSQRYDTDNIHSIDTNPSRLTCRTSGKYIIVALIWWTANVAGYRSVSIILNGSNYIANVERKPSPTNFASQTLTTVWNLVEGDYITVEAYHNIGLNPLNILAFEAISPEFMMQRIG